MKSIIDNWKIDAVSTCNNFLQVQNEWWKRIKSDNIHLKNIYKDWELNENSTTEDFSVVQNEGWYL